MMRYWDSKKIKERAKDVLKGTYWKRLGVAIICSLLTGSFAITMKLNSGEMPDLDTLLHSEWYGPYIMHELLPAMSAATVIAGLAGIAIRLFVSRPVQIGEARFDTLCSYGVMDFKEVFTPFKAGHLVDNAVAMLLRDIKVVLWSLLFIIPGICKSYEYFMIPYILAENPAVNEKRAFEISRNTTYGEKGTMFRLDLSFIGWYLLGIMGLGIGILFVIPYHRAARAELYGALRLKAVKEGYCSKDEIGAELFV